MTNSVNKHVDALRIIYNDTIPTTPYSISFLSFIVGSYNLPRDTRKLHSILRYELLLDIEDIESMCWEHAIRTLQEDLRATYGTLEALWVSTYRYNLIKTFRAIYRKYRSNEHSLSHISSDNHREYDYYVNNKVNRIGTHTWLGPLIQYIDLKRSIDTLNAWSSYLAYLVLIEDMSVRDIESITLRSKSSVHRDLDLLYDKIPLLRRINAS